MTRMICHGCAKTRDWCVPTVSELPRAARGTCCCCRQEYREGEVLYIPDWYNPQPTDKDAIDGALWARPQSKR